MAVWVENSSLPAPGMVSQDLHLSCSDIETCLPIGGQREEVKNQGLELESTFANRTVQQILFEFYTKPTNPKRTMLATAAKPFQQKENIARIAKSCPENISSFVKVSGVRCQVSGVRCQVKCDTCGE